MIVSPPSPQPSKTNPALTWFWTFLGCCASPRPKKLTPNNRPFNWDAEGGYIPFRFQGAYRARWRRGDRQARFEESREKKEVNDIEKKAHEIEKGVEGGKGKEGRMREGRCETHDKPVKEGKEGHARNKVRKIEKTVERVEGGKERRTRKKRTRKYVHVHEMSMTEAHEIMERAIATQIGGKNEGEVQMQVGKAGDEILGDYTDPKLGSPSIVGLSKTACAGTGTSEAGHKVEKEGTLDELERNRKAKSRSVLGLSGVTLVE